MWHFDQFPRSYEVTKFCIRRTWRHTREWRYFFLACSCKFYEEWTFNKILWCCGLFFINYEVAKLRSYEVCDVIHAHKHTQYANCGLHVSFLKFWLLPFCFMMKKDFTKQKMLVWSQVLFKWVYLKRIWDNISQCRPRRNFFSNSFLPPPWSKCNNLNHIFQNSLVSQDNSKVHNQNDKVITFNGNAKRLDKDIGFSNRKNNFSWEIWRIDTFKFNL